MHKANTDEAILAGAAVVDLAPPTGLMMAGYAARTKPAIGIHDPLTARAIAVGDTAIVVADVIGLDANSCARIRARCILGGDNVVVIATHTHGGPVSISGFGGATCDPVFLERLEAACIEAIDRAVAARRPARLWASVGLDPGIAFNRRHEGGTIDATVPVLGIDAIDDDPIAILVFHACHPVVLAAYNREYTSDYPHYVRLALEEARPGAVAVYLPGCSGDVSTGHSPHSSISTVAMPDRTYREAERLGRRVAASALAAQPREMRGIARINSSSVSLDLTRNEPAALPILAAEWREKAAAADAAWKALYLCWVDWAEGVAQEALTPWQARVTAIDWGGCRLCFLPGEMFAQSALNIRRADTGAYFVTSFADGVPGYIPPTAEYPFGGYEVLEAHRYYGMPAAFAMGSAERLEAAAIALARARF